MGIVKHYKMYKKGKNWCYMAIATLAVAVGALSVSQGVSADTIDSTVNTTSATVVSPKAQDQTTDVAAEVTPATQSTSEMAKQDDQANSTTQTDQQSSATNKSAVAPQAAALQNGWQTDKGSSYYYKDGQKVTGQQTINGKNYYFNAQGQQQKNYFLNQANHTYYFQADGTRLDDGFYNNWGHTYYFQKDGSRLDNGFYNNWGHTYYFGQGGVRLDDGFYNNWGHAYYFQKDGSRLDNGFYNNWGHTYYFGNDGALVQGTGIWANGSFYRADNGGILSPISVYNNKINSYIMNNGIGHANISYVNAIPDVSSHSYSGTTDGKPNMVVVHETANPNDSIWGEINYEKQHYNSAFVHAFVDANNIIQISDTDHEAWGAAYPANGRAVQFEQVEVYGAWNFARELVNAAYYTAYNMRKYGLTPSLAQSNGTGTLWSHHNVSQYLGNTNHTDPDGYWSNRASSYFGTGYNMNDFLQLVNYEYSKLS